MSDETSQRSTSDDDRAGWQAYWKAQGMAWRTQPEIPPERQEYLAERRAVQPDIEKGIYPFRDERGSIKLTRADVEWLLTTHESSSMCGPVDWSDEQQRHREGIDVRGADLTGADLSRLPLTRLCGGLVDVQFRPPEAVRAEGAVILRQAQLLETHLEGAELSDALIDGADLRRVRLDGAILRRTHLDRAILRRAHLEGADLFEAHLAASDLFEAHLEGADIRRTVLDSETNLTRAYLADGKYGCASLLDVRWNGANLSVIDWTVVRLLGDEQTARRRGVEADRTGLLGYDAAVRATRQVAVVLRELGANERADYFAYRAQMLQRQVLRRQGIRKWSAYIGSLLLDLLAGYGYRPGRAILLYLAVIIWFANFYVWASHGLITLGLPPSQVESLAWYEALILSVSSFHGRGFQPFQHLNDPVAALAGMQAIFGLVIEVSFIATFTQRYFGK